MREMATPEQRPNMDVARLLSASKSYSALLRRIIVSQSVLNSVLKMAGSSDASRERVQCEHEPGITGLQSVLKETAGREAIDPVRDFDKIAEVLAQQTSVNGESVIAAAVLLLSHAIADDALTGACGLAIDLDPGAWIADLSLERKVTLGSILEKGTSGVFAGELDKLRQQLASKPLANRAEQFFRHVKIRHHPEFDPMDFRYFRVSKLKEADELRNSIVHGSGIVDFDLVQAGRTMLFLHEAAIVAMRSLAYSYHLPMEWSILFGNSEAQNKIEGSQAPDGSL
jgi:hypothetical protein